MSAFRKERDSHGEIEVAEDCLWGAQTERALRHFSIGRENLPREMLEALVLIKKAAAFVNHRQGRLSREKMSLIVIACEEILSGRHDCHFPLKLWVSGSGTQCNMNLNEVIANRCSQLAGMPLGSKEPVHPNDDVNLSQSTNDVFPSAMYLAVARAVHEQLLPAIERLQKGIEGKSEEWSSIVKVGRTHLQDATPLTLGQEFSGYSSMLRENVVRIKTALQELYSLSVGGTAVGTGVNTLEGYDQEMAKEIAEMTQLPFRAGINKFALQGAHDGLVQMSGTLKTLAVSLYKIANDIRFLACGPRAGIQELQIPANEPGSSIMPGKVNPTQCEVLTMVAARVFANDLAVTLGGAGGMLEMNMYKPLMIDGLLHSISLLHDGMENFLHYLVEGLEPNEEQIALHLNHSLMLVTALLPHVGYDKAAQIAHHAYEKEITIREAALQLGYLSGEEFDRIVDPKSMISPQKLH